jgi:phosphoribosylanthranilate isomerase
MTKVKICGITNLEDAERACEYGADALGFNFYERSLRYISPRKARLIIDKLPSFVQTVGIFVEDTPKEINAIAEYVGITMVQVHSELSIKDTLKIMPRAMKTFRVKSDFDVTDVKWFYDRTGIGTFLFDAYHEKLLGGTGKQMSLAQAKKICSTVEKFAYPIIAGGLNETNVSQFVAACKPYGVDVATGIEAAIGKKDKTKLKLFIERAKAA